MRVSLGVWIGARYIFGKNGRLLAHFFPPIIAIALSVMTIVVVFNVSNGMIRGIITKFIETGIYHIRASSQRVYDIDDLRSVQERLLANPFIEQVGFEYNGVALLSANNVRQGVSIRALSREIWHDDPSFREHIIVEQGSFALSAPSDIMVGTHLAQQMDIEVGDEVQIISLNRFEGAVVPRISNYRVQGVFTAGYRNLDRLWVLLPFEHALQSLATDSVQTVVGVKIADPFALYNPIIRGGNAQQAQSVFREVRRQFDEFDDDFDVRTWFEFRARRFLSFRSTKNILLFIMVLIIAVAMIHLISVLNTLVTEKRAEIAYLKSIGASGRYIRTIFISCGSFIGFGGASLGILMGLLASIHINRLLRVVEAALARFQQIAGLRYGINLALLRREFYLEQIPVTISLLGIVYIFSLTLLLAIVAALLPARASIKINPIRILSGTPR